ncbi:MAG: hypothetical protein BAJALOKI2v1_800002 [Promethearchaeota archaeon]|nr:MAG: hypothetical protein BAJALOKI2v1_800002 [Candidatus Lokiarchaeota archaeon]
MYDFNLNLKRSKITKILNFLLACFKRIGNLTRAIYELEVSLHDKNCKPDLFCLLKEKEDFYYSLFEMKKRSIFSLSDLDENIRPQYHTYLEIEPTHLDDLLIPKINEANIHINYLFYDSDEHVINQIIKMVPIDTNVYDLNFQQKRLISIQTESKNLNHSLMEKIIELSNESTVWNKIYVPFTFEDIKEFKGKGGNTVDIHNNAGIILSYNFLMFIFSRKIKGESSNFRTEDFIKYVFQNNYSNLNIGWEERSKYERKFNLFLKFMSEQLTDKMDINPIIVKERIGYRILLRNTETLRKRIFEITKELINFLRQKRIPDFID